MGDRFILLQKKLDKPFDERMRQAMYAAMESLMSSISGAEIGFTQSDEISIFVKTYNKFETQAWHGGKIQKMISSAASIATASFIQYLSMFEALQKHAFTATFDCRIFNLPLEEVANYFLWRGKDCFRNAVMAYYLSLNSHKSAQNKSTSELLELIPKHNWNTVADESKFGILLFKDSDTTKRSYSCPIGDMLKNVNDVVNHREDQ